MRLHDWIDQFPVAQRRLIREAIARATDVTEMAVRHWANGIRRVPGQRCLAIERFTASAVTRYELRPDIFGKLSPPRVVKRRAQALA
jgi:DNA-binding transcriptional regulator YdaS (Cro superfamily)